jgi:hypothetical protein
VLRKRPLVTERVDVVEWLAIAAISNVLGRLRTHAQTKFNLLKENKEDTD